jgi:uncharacterized protein with ParB-like and HNH nuclease domain
MQNNIDNYKQNQIFENEILEIEIEEEQEISEPFDATKIKIDARQITIDLVLNRIKYNEIELSPDFQRDSSIWGTVAKSRLIESMLIRIPLPAFYIDATDDNKWIVIDGQQRLITIKHFVLGLTENYKQDNVLRLSNLEFLTQFNGKSYEEIPRNYQRRINETQITIYLIEKGTPEELKFNIFKRINTGGLPLSPQEIRHALNQGKATKFLEKLSESNEFRLATSNSIRDERMAARETILRFLSFKITDFSTYASSDLDTFLNNAMKTMNKMSDIELENLEKDFVKAMLAANEIFGYYAFRKQFEKNSKKMPFNKSLFESWAVNLSSLNDDQIAILINKKHSLIDSFIKLMKEDLYFVSAISQGTGDNNKIRYRFGTIQNLIKYTLQS